MNIRLAGSYLVAALVLTVFLAGVPAMADTVVAAEAPNPQFVDGEPAAAGAPAASTADEASVSVVSPTTPALRAATEHRRTLLQKKITARGEASEWFMNQRSLPSPQISRSRLLTALPAAAARSGIAAGRSVRWESIGPAPIYNVTMFGDGDLTSSGRALSIAIHPQHPEILLLGAAQGGIWRSTNGGRNWTPVADDMPSLAVKVIRFAPSNPDIVYAGSGEPHSKTSIFGMGVFKSADGGLTWTALPSNGADWDFRYVAVSGLQVDPGNPNLLYVTTANVLPDRVNAFEPPPSAPQTGIFKSVNGGLTWRRVQDAVDYRAYMYPEWDPYRASGIGFMDLELFRQNPAVLYASELSGGIYRSTNYGETWQRITPVKNPSGTSDAGADFPAPVPSFYHLDPATYLFSTLNRIPRIKKIPEMNRIELALSQQGPGITSDYTTAVLYAGVGAVIKLDVNSDGLFDPDDDIQTAVGLLFKSSDGGNTWQWLGDWSKGVPNYCDTYPIDDGGHPFMDCLYDNTVEVNPLNPDEVVIGGNANYSTYWPDPVVSPVRMLELPWSGMVYRTADGGTSWTDTTPACSQYAYDPTQSPLNGLPVFTCLATPSELVTHPDTHGAAFDTTTGGFYTTNDGGLYRCDVTTDPGTSAVSYAWSPLNTNLSTLQFFNFGVHPDNPDRILGGMQDNATAFWNGSFWDAWDYFGGDGNVGRFDPKEPQRVYTGWQYALARNDSGNGEDPAAWTTLFDSAIGVNDTLPFVTIFDIDPVDTTKLYVGSNTGLYRSTDRGDTWEARLNTEAFDGQVTAVSVSPKDHQLVWAGTSTGRIYLFDMRLGRIYDRTGKKMPNRWVSSIKASPRSRSAVVVTFSGYDAASKDTSNGGNGYAGRVFRSTSLGRNWTDMSGNLTMANGLDIPVSALALDPKNDRRLWVGTDFGVYETTNRGQKWAAVKGNMPLVAVTALDYSESTGYLMAATFGRGIWRTIVPEKP